MEGGDDSAAMREGEKSEDEQIEEKGGKLTSRTRGRRERRGRGGGERVNSRYRNTS